MSDNIDGLMKEVAANKPTKKFIYDDEADLVKTMNGVVQMIALGDDTRFVIRNDKGEPRFLRRRDAETELAQYQLASEVEKKDGTTKLEMRAGFGIWLKSEDRRKYEGQIFKPWYGVNEDPEPSRYLNMWTGYAIEPAPGDWSLMRGHIKDNVCCGNEEQFQYLMALQAQLFQHPEEKIGVAVALRGPKGVGKSILTLWIRKIIGARHAMVADKKEQWTGRFTEQLRYLIFLGCEEGLFAGSHEQDSAIKHIITSEDFTYEAKGKDINSSKNYTRVWITSNEDWAVPATAGERRYFVLDVGSAQMQNTEYFAAIDAQMKAGGAAAMLHDLLEFDYSAIDLRNPPKTDALKDQIETGLPANLAWLASALGEGQFPFLDRSRAPVAWPDKPDNLPKDEALYVLKSDVQDSYRDFVPGRRDRPVTESAVGKFMVKNIPGAEGVRKRVQAHPKGVGILTPHYLLPWLSDARAAFLKAHSGVTIAAVDRNVDEPETDLQEAATVPPEVNEPETAQEAARRSNVVVPMQRRSRF